ncbi:RHS repeat-associated core domain-containing protein [Pseudomonas sp. SZMC_28357]|uniref:RHS repeat-associated core domain-containing protein n=1 Tax=Pseudomonas sp. SZMC_28357 TaxID=3074380 RepID=UPI002872200A|nr:RHS repeat-associated core domain-containing protein [Pseudomonas sp. SZMC_28357]MDR9754599.1 RHS repeat-associated core domain-containing protein [Pseudomonas sp. SZMC_28357]
MNAAVHWRTPTLLVQDSRGLPVRQVEYLRKVSDGTRRALITRQTHNTVGQQVEQWDPRLWGTDAAPNLLSMHRLSGEPIRVQSVDAGWRLSLAGPGGEVRQRWDQRGTQWLTTFDEQLRVISVIEDQAEVERYRYADATADAGHNLRGQLLEHSDPAGTLALDSYSLLGQVMGETRAFSPSERHICQRRYNPLGEVLEQTDAGGHRQLLRYDRAGQFQGSRLQLDPQSEPLPIISDSHYDAAGQLLEQRMANGVLNRWHYDPADGRLTQWQAGPDNRPALQDLRYRYDRVGNVVAIDDALFQPVFFANQRVDANREFSYDSLYRLISANGFEGDVPQSRPGLPPLITPIDNGRLYNYVQHYAYDDGGNLTTLRHVRDGHNFTRQMRIDPRSNRGVEWTAGNPEPVFERLFDGHGNQLALQPGQPLTWNSRDQLTVARLVERNGGPHDEETYLYSQGQRVSKRLVTQAPTVSHVRQVRYLPGLEIRTLDDREELHVIQLGNVRCLHWRKGRPAAIEQDQLRFSLDDHLGSSTLELDRQGRVISHERYYPFGGTAWWAATSQVQADYKTIRYSGKEMDVSGLYYYGARYYAPWLQRWVSADPAGDVDGLNLYGFVGNNPLRYVDVNGKNRHQFAVFNYSRFISVLGNHAATTLAQVDGILDGPDPKTGAVVEGMLLNLIGETMLGLVGYESGVVGSEITSSFLPVDNHIANLTRQSTPPFLAGLIGGNVGGDIAGPIAEGFKPTARLIRPLLPQTSSMTIAQIDYQAGITDNEERANWTVSDTISFAFNRVIGTVVPGVTGVLNMGSRAQEAEDIQNRLDPVKMHKIDTMLQDWKTTVNERWAGAQSAFDALGRDVVSPSEIAPNVNANSPDFMRHPIHRAALAHQTHVTLDLIDRAQRGMAYYRDLGTTDNQWILRTPRAAKYRGLSLPARR